MRDQGCQHCSKQDRGKRAKNNFCGATPAVDITYDTLKELQQAIGPHDPDLGNPENSSRPSHAYTVAAGSLQEWQLVRLAAFVHLARYFAKKKDGTGGENVNCLPARKTAQRPTNRGGAGAEQSGSGKRDRRSQPALSPGGMDRDNLNHFRDHLFRFTGQLFLDTSHTACGPGTAKGCALKRISVLGGPPGLRHRSLREHRRQHLPTERDQWMGLPGRIPGY